MTQPKPWTAALNALLKTIEDTNKDNEKALVDDLKDVMYQVIDHIPANKETKEVKADRKRDRSASPKRKAKEDDDDTDTKEDNDEVLCATCQEPAAPLLWLGDDIGTSKSSHYLHSQD